MNKHKNRILVVMALIIGMLFVLSGVMPAQAEAPSNDNIASATRISVSDLPFSDSVETTDATLDMTDPNPEWCIGNAHIDRTVWYTYETDRTMTVLVTSNDSNYQYMSVIYYGSPGNLEMVVCNIGNNSFPAYPGRTYYIMIAEYVSPGPYPPPPTDQYSLNTQFTELFSIANDYFDNRTKITTMPFNDFVEVTGAWFEPYEKWPSCYTDYPTWSIWYEYRPDRDGVLQDSTDYYGSTAVWIGSSLESLQELGCSNWGSAVSVSVTAGQAYYIQFSYPYYATNNNVHLNFIAPPENDMFANRQAIPFPFDSGSIDLTLATRESLEPTSSCSWWYGSNNTIWYEYTPDQTRSMMLSVASDHFAAIYTGTGLGALNEIGCTGGGPVTRLLNAGTTYYIQVGSYWNPGNVTFSLSAPPAPQAGFGYWPSDPSVYEDVSFGDSSSDPGGGSIATWDWSFGDGATGTGASVSHRYAQDGSYTVSLAITTLDGRTAFTTQTINVRTHDVGITRFVVPNSASTGQTRQINVEINNKRYSDTVRVELYKITPNGDVYIGTLIQTIPVRPSNRTTVFAFSYTFTKEDAAFGKVNFKAVVSIDGARDAYPGDNQAISMPVKVGR